MDKRLLYSPRDRFHFVGHICNSIADPDSYMECSLDAVSGAESINQQ